MQININYYIMVIPNPPAELFYKFNDISYHDEPHKYFLNGKSLTSVTTLIHKYQSEFEEDKWAVIKGNEYGIDPEEVKYAWKFINEKATTKGSIIHDYAENLFLNKKFPYPKDQIIRKFGYDPIIEEYLKTKKHIDNFYDLVKDVLIPIKTELVVYDEEYMISGMIDLLFYNKKSKMFEIWDYKTNSSDNAFKNKIINGKTLMLNGILKDVEDNDKNLYSLQLSTYKYIIEKNTSLKLGDSHLIWVSCKNENFEIIKCNDYTDYVLEMFKDHYFKNNLRLGV